MPRIPHIGKIAGGAAVGAALIAGIFTHQHEGRVYQTYFDIAHVATICDGHTRNVKPGMVADDTMCDTLLTTDLQVAFNALDRYLYFPEKLKPYTRAAAADFVLWQGAEAFRTSTFRRLLNFKDPSPNVQVRLHHRGAYLEPDVQGACNSLLWWDKYKDPKTGKMVISAGLAKRSRDERALCLGELLP